MGELPKWKKIGIVATLGVSMFACRLTQPNQTEATPTNPAPVELSPEGYTFEIGIIPDKDIIQENFQWELLPEYNLASSDSLLNNIPGFGSINTLEDHPDTLFLTFNNNGSYEQMTIQPTHRSEDGKLTLEVIRQSTTAPNNIGLWVVQEDEFIQIITEEPIIIKPYDNSTPDELKINWKIAVQKEQP